MSERSRIVQREKLSGDEVALMLPIEPQSCLIEARGLGIYSPYWTSRETQDAIKEGT